MRGSQLQSFLPVHRWTAGAVRGGEAALDRAGGRRRGTSRAADQLGLEVDAASDERGRRTYASSVGRTQAIPLLASCSASSGPTARDGSRWCASWLTASSDAGPATGLLRRPVTVAAVLGVRVHRWIPSLAGVGPGRLPGPSREAMRNAELIVVSISRSGRPACCAAGISQPMAVGVAEPVLDHAARRPEQGVGCVRPPESARPFAPGPRVGIPSRACAEAAAPASVAVAPGTGGA